MGVGRPSCVSPLASPLLRFIPIDLTLTYTEIPLRIYALLSCILQLGQLWYYMPQMSISTPLLDARRFRNILSFQRRSSRRSKITR